MKKIKLYYGIHNCGDGSASLSLYETQKLASWDQDYQNSRGDGFAEDCSGSIEIDLDNDIGSFNSSEICSVLYYFVDNVLDNWDETSNFTDWDGYESFVETFFRDSGIPKFKVKYDDTTDYYKIYTADDDKYITEIKLYRKSHGQAKLNQKELLKIETFLNNLE